MSLSKFGCKLGNKSRGEFFLTEWPPRRLDKKNRTLGEWLREEVAEPHEADVHFGLRDDEISRVAKLSSWSPVYAALRTALSDELGGGGHRPNLMSSALAIYRRGRAVVNLPFMDTKNVPLSEG